MALSGQTKFGRYLLDFRVHQVAAMLAFQRAQSVEVALVFSKTPRFAKFSHFRSSRIAFWSLSTYSGAAWSTDVPQSSAYLWFEAGTARIEGVMLACATLREFDRSSDRTAF